MENKTALADTIIRNHVLFAAGGGLIPIPLMDIAAVTAIQIDMLQQISSLYGVNYSKSAGKLRISAIAGGAFARAGTEILLKIIPGIGWVVGGISMSILSASSTYGLGQVFVKHFEGGGDLYDFDPKDYKKEYEKEVENGKEKLTEWQEEEKQKEEDGQATKLAKLKELGQLKADGVITEEEFEEMKKKIVEEF